MERENRHFAVAGILIVNNKVLLVRHTYGNAKGRLLIPGGYVNKGEMPENAVSREFIEETSVIAIPKDIVAIKVTKNNWYIVYEMEYVSGDAISDGKENSQASYFSIKEILNRDDVTETTKELLRTYKHNKLRKSSYCPKRFQKEDYTLYI